MSDKKIEDKIIKDIDEAEAFVYKQVFGIFDKDNGDFVKVKSEEIIKEVEKSKKKKEGKKSGRKPKSNVKDEFNQIIQELSEKEISSMVITIKINGIVEEYVNDEKAGEKYLTKDAQIEKIKEAVNGFKNIIIVHSEEELKKLQEDFIKKQEKKKKSENKIDDSKSKSVANKGENNKESNNVPKVKTQVYIRISESDYETVKDIIDNENISIIANKVKTRDDKSGINMIIQYVDADKVRNILNQNKISMLQDVDGNIDWEDIKERSDKFENITVDQLREFQNKNNDKFDYIAFRKDDVYTIFADKKCDIAIGASGRKTLKQLESKVEEHKSNNTNKTTQNNKNKGNISKEER